MTVEDLKKQIEDRLGLAFLLGDVIIAFNECLMDLAEVLRLETIAYADLTEEHRTVALPTHSSSGDVYELIMVKASKNGELPRINLNDDVSKGYKYFGKEMTFQELVLPDQVTIWYYRYPNPITALADVPDIPERFVHALKYYFIAQYQQEDEELELEENYWNKYYRVKSEIDKHTTKQRGMHRARHIKPAVWR